MCVTTLFNFFNASKKIYLKSVQVKPFCYTKKKVKRALRLSQFSNLLGFSSKTLFSNYWYYYCIEIIRTDNPNK